MLIGVPKEIKNHEYRVGMTPASVRELVAHGHSVFVEHNAGSGIGFGDADYTTAGATVLATAAEVFAKSDMIVKVKEPQAVERAMLRDGQILFTYLHLAPDLPQTEDLIKSKAICIAYETVTDNRGGLPLLAPMSEVAGRLAIQAGATALQKANGGNGTLLDNTLLVWTNELGKGNSHTLDNIPFVLVGNGLDFRMGRSLRYGRVPHNRLLMSLAHGFGHRINQFGNPNFCGAGVLENLT